MPGILEGIKVVDWTIYQVGPFASAMLADLGADVIHVEERGRGDLLRGLTQSGELSVALPHGRHLHFEEHNRNKRGMALDLKKPEGRQIMYRLAEHSDVFMTNLRTKAVQKLGMDYESISGVNPRIIYAQATGFGRKGADADAPSVDNLGLARSGMMMASGFEGDPPTPISVGTGDRVTAFMLAYGIMGALLARERFGITQEVHTSMLGACLVLHGWTVMPPIILGKEYQRKARLSAGGALYNCYQCKDGRWVTMALLQDRYWPQFCQVIERPDLVNDPRFRDMNARREHTQELVELLEKLFKTKTSEEWHQIVLQKGQDLLFTLVNRPGELLSDPQVTENNYITDWDHPVLGPIKFVGFPVDWSETPATLRMPAPDYGQHTEEVLLEVGYTWDDIARFQELEVI